MAASSSGTAPFPAPNGFRWVYVTEFRHYRSKKLIQAVNYGKKAFCFLVRVKKS